MDSQRRTAWTGRTSNWKSTGEHMFCFVFLTSCTFQILDQEALLVSTCFLPSDSNANSYHKSSLSKEQLEVIVLGLQKKVKMLQQRHRRHLEKLVGLENTVSQLRQNNLLNEERLQLLERVKGPTMITDVEIISASMGSKIV